MRALAKVGLIVMCIVGPFGMMMPILNLVAAPIVGVAALPVAWYVLFTLPAERAEQHEALQQLVGSGSSRRLT